MYKNYRSLKNCAAPEKRGASIFRQSSAAALLALLILQNLLLLSPAEAKPLVSTDVVISQIYGGGGNTGATYTNDFIELFNRGTAPVSLNGWSVQYASATGSSWGVTNLTNVTLAPGRYYLVQESAGTGGTQPLPTPDAAGTLALSATNGKVALVTDQTALTCGGSPTACGSVATIKDLVGFGSATTYEGSGATAVLSNTTAALRGGGGCTDTDNNAGDFTATAPAPRNTSSPVSPCSGGGSTNPSGTGAATPNPVTAGGTTLLTVTVTPGINPASTALAVAANLTAIGGAATQALFDDGTNGDATAGDNIFSYNAAIPAGTAAGAKTLPVTISDAQARTGTTNITLTVNSSSAPLSAIGAAAPSSVLAGAATLLTVTVTPGTNPASTGIGVAVNLTAIGGSAAQSFFDDGTNGDVTAGDNTFSFSAVVAPATAGGVKTLTATATDAQMRSASAAISLTVTAPATAQPLPFSQNWSNTNLITADNDWSGVPGIVGYRGDDLTTAIGTDPQTILADGASTPVNVLANQTSPDTLLSGGVAEFEIANPVIALQGSATGDAPHVVISLDTTGANNITVSYNLRDIDASADNAVQPVALQYRIGSTGNYINIPAAFVADASSGPNAATLVTPVNVALPAATANQPLVQLRIITSNAVGSDEWIGVDDINVLSNGTLPLSGTGSANPNQVSAGSSTLLTVSVNPATNPASTGISVTGNLTTVGGAAAQTFYDDGTNGDATPGDNVFSYLATIPLNFSGGNRTVSATITDAQSRQASATISLTIFAAPDPQEHLVLGNPTGATTDVNNPFNYLLLKTQYVMSYHRDRGTPNWVSWHLDSSWLGGAPRQDDFRPDPSLPAGWYQVTQFDYQGTGFDRGHHTPSGDRTRSIPDNSATFFMTNMMPQAPFNNQGPWEELESYCRTLVTQGNELYIIAGGTGIGGVGSNGGVTTTIANGKVTVPAYTWKVILVIPNGDDDLMRINKLTRTIAVIMPNRQDIGLNTPWRNFRVSVKAVEALTGYNFFSNVRPQIRRIIKTRTDTQ